MVKTINLPDAVYEDLVAISEELSAVAKRPVSLAMAVSILTEVYQAHLSEPCARDAFRQRLSTSKIMSPEDFEKAWDIEPTKFDESQNKSKIKSKKK